MKRANMFLGLKIDWNNTSDGREQKTNICVEYTDFKYMN